MILKEMPSVFRMYRKLLFSSRPKVNEQTSIPKISHTIENFEIDPLHLQAYKDLCFFSGQNVPVTYPYALAGPLHLAVIVDKSFPLKAAGLLHIRNHITSKTEISLEKPVTLTVKTGEYRFRPQGLEFDIITSISQNGSEAWTCISTLLKRGTFQKEDAASPLEEIFKKLGPDQQSYLQFKAPANIGRLYAKICKDYNPIHVSVIMAKVFGFKRTIAHGMWVSAAVLGKMEKENISTFDIAFKGPVFTGSQIDVKEKNKQFNVFNKGNDRPVILGIINR